MIVHMVSGHASPLAALRGAGSGGPSLHVAALAAALAARGHDVTVFTRRDDPAPPARVALAAGFAVEHVDAGPPRPVPRDRLLPHLPEFADRLERRWFAGPPDVVHGHFWMSGWAALAAAAVHGVPVVQTFHALGGVERQGGDDPGPDERGRMEPQVARAARAIIATCRDEAAELRAFGVARDRLAVVPCGVDPGLFRPGGPVAPRTERPRILGVGRLVRREGLETVLEALAAVPDAELIVVGGPPRGGGDPAPAALREAARRLGVADRVTFLGGVPHAEVPALMRSADVVVGVPWYAPFRMVPVEAMACGRPVVASAVGGHLDTVVDGVTGVLVPPRDPAALAAALRDLLDRPEHRAALGAAGAARARARYAWEQVAASTEAVYARVAHRTGTALSGTRS